MRSVILAGFGAARLRAPAGAALGAEDDQTREDFEAFEEQAREGLATLMMALESFIESIPQYQMPEILENGDIIIRRVHPDERPAPEGDPEAEPKQI